MTVAAAPFDHNRLRPSACATLQNNLARDSETNSSIVNKLINIDQMQSHWMT